MRGIYNITRKNYADFLKWESFAAGASDHFQKWSSLVVFKASGFQKCGSLAAFMGNELGWTQRTSDAAAL